MAFRLTNRISLHSLSNFFFEGKSTLNLMCCLLWGQVLLDYIVAAFRHFIPGIPSNEYISIPLIALSVVLAIPAILKRLQIVDILFYVACIAIYILQYILYPDNLVPLEKYAYLCCFTVFPFYFLGKILDLPKMINAFYYISVGTICMSLFYFLLYREGSSVLSTDDYNMAAAYSLLPHVVMVAWVSIRRLSPLHICLAALGVLLLFMFGTRGPILSFAVALSAYVLLRNDGKHARFIKISYILLVLFLLIFLVPLATFFSNLFSDIDVSVRFFSKLLDNEISDDSGRGDLILELNRHLLTERPFFGYGLFGSYKFIGGYPHNIFYELIFTFGFFAGSFLIIWLLLHFFNGYRYAPNELNREFILLFTVMEMTHLCFSYTFLTEQMFFLLIGFCSQRTKSVFHSAIDSIQPNKTMRLQ